MQFRRRNVALLNWQCGVLWKWTGTIKKPGICLRRTESCDSFSIIRRFVGTAGRHAFIRLSRKFGGLLIWMTVDRVSFNPPERAEWRFPGPFLHWNTTLAPPIRFAVSGLIYLTDTEAEQGAFTCVPGFHRRIEDWLKGLPPNANPRDEDLEALGAVPIPGRAGDLVIWHRALPHGSRPNRCARPRIVQYLNMHPAIREYRPTWK